jgi:diadenosine tetraphosphatase ApaH/serine/threonine PP2A family protein phosphatase
LRYLILTDIHANLEALEVCLTDATRRKYDATLVLGDLVGYGADPNAVVERVQGLKPVAIVRGNHDKVACGLEQAEGFNSVARSAARWTLEVLTPEHRTWLANLPTGPHDVDDVIQICHGSPFDEDAYIFDELDAVRALKLSTRPLCLFGHTHYPITFELSAEGFDSIGPSAAPVAELKMKNGSKYLVNPGSVGQPRDGDARAAWALIDTDESRAEFRRVAYPIEETQAEIRERGLPSALSARLAQGI